MQCVFPTKTRSIKEIEQEQVKLKKRDITDYYQRKDSNDEAEPVFNKPFKKKKEKMNILNYFKPKNKKKNRNVLPFSKPLLVQIMGFLGLKENIRFSNTCRIANTAFKFLFIFSDYFDNINTENFDHNEINFIRKKKKTAQLTILDKMLKGKSVKSFLAKNSLFWETDSVNGKSKMRKFIVAPKKSKMAYTHLQDSNFIELVTKDSIKLNDLKLINCFMLTARSFAYIKRFRNLQTLHVTFNKYLSDRHVKEMVDNCKHIICLNLSKCPELTEESLYNILNYSTWLETLNLSENPKMFKEKEMIEYFGKAVMLSEVNLLKCGLNLDDLINIIQLCRGLKKIIIDRSIFINQDTTQVSELIKQKEIKVMFS